LSLIRDAVSFLCLPEGTEENHENLTQDSRCLDQDLNRQLPECKSETLQLESNFSSMDVVKQC
jgi:hypothetical protein